MAYINGGAKYRFENDFLPISTKAQLKRLIVSEPERVHFYSTSEYGSQFNGPVTELHSSEVLSVVGPDPYTNRKWYATISMHDGKLRVK